MESRTEMADPSFVLSNGTTGSEVKKVMFVFVVRDGETEYKVNRKRGEI